MPPALAAAARIQNEPKYQVVTKYKASGKLGMPGPYPGRVVSLLSKSVINPATEKVEEPVVREMMRRGMLALTGDKDIRDSWRRFIEPNDVVGIKTNCSGAPQICSHPIVVGEIVRNLVAIGVKPTNIHLYERFANQLVTVKYENYVPAGVHVKAIGEGRAEMTGYDPHTYVECDFFGEDDGRSNMVRLVTETFTKIVNVPNMKDHGASGVTGCLKNIAYGNFHNVARSHKYTKTNTLSFIGTLASVEPLRSKAVLSVMDGLKAVWQGGPFAPKKEFRFYPGQMMFGTDPVAMDRLLLDIIEDERKRHGYPSVWTRELPKGDHYLREPGHIEFAGKLGLGVHDKSKIKLEEIRLA